jgi:hypothetical protein
VTGVATLFGVRMTQKHSERKDDQNRRSIMLQKKRQIYSELMGQKKTVVQTHISYHATNIYKASLNYIHNCQSICHIVDPKLFQQYQEEDRLCNDLIQQNAVNGKDLWMIIGLIQVTFNSSPKLEDFITKIAQIEEILEDLDQKINAEAREHLNDINVEAKSLSLGSLLEWYKTRDKIITFWRDDRNKDCKKQTDALEAGIDDLLRYLKDQIQEDESSTP